MRLGAVYPQETSSPYRAIEPLRAMERRGHDVAWPDTGGALDFARLAQCDVVHVYRSASDQVRRLIRDLAGEGVSITYDNDDNLAALPSRKRHAQGEALSRGRQHAMTVKAARMADVFTTSTEVLADLYRAAGVKHVEVIDNYVAPDVPRPTVRHSNVVIGWFGDPTHRDDADHLRIPATLQELLARHADVRIECVGVDLQLPERYRYDFYLPFDQLVQRIGGFDIGIAPLADLPINHGRSSIKVKEYAASGVPWLASPVGGYATLGEAQGGRLVADDGWLHALERLVTHRRERRRLARKAKKWADGQTMDAGAERWEKVFLQAASQRR